MSPSIAEGHGVFGPLLSVIRAGGLEPVPDDPGTFTLQANGNTGWLGLTTSKFSNPKAASISCHISVESRILTEVFGPPFGPWHPPGHWVRWTGTLEDDADERQPWLVIPGDASSYRIAIADLERLALPALRGHLDDAILRDEWLAGDDLMLPPVVKEAYTLVLLERLGPSDRIPLALRRLEERLGDADPRAEDYRAIEAGLLQTSARRLVPGA